MKASLYLNQRSLFELSRDISWAEHNKKGYIIRDPANSDELLYLSESDYNKLIRVMLSNNTSIDVIATPRDTPISVSRRFPGADKASTESPFKMGQRFSRDFMFNLLPGWILKESMITFNRNIKSFFPSYYKTILSWMGHKSSRANSKLVRVIGLHLETIEKTRGINQLILYLKISSIAVMQYLAGTPLSSTEELGQRVKLINGLPAFLPSQIRYLIRSRNIVYIRALTSVLHSYKAIVGKYGEPNLDSISAPRFHLPKDGSRNQMIFPGFDELTKVKSLPFSLDIFDSFEELEAYAPSFWDEYNISNIKCKFNIDVEEPPMTLTVGPNHKVSFIGSGLDALAHFHKGQNKLLFSFIKTVQQEWYQPELGIKESWRFDGLPEVVVLMEHLSKQLEKFWLKEKISLSDQLPTLSLGKLAIKLEAAGKIRVFAISDYWTQWVCRPIQESMFSVLRTIPSDATFDQLKSVQDFMSRPHSYIASYDLKSATDLIPQQLYTKVLAPFMGTNTAEAWVNMLVNRDYNFKGVAYRYTRGQPMGTISSWSGLAIIHHFLVYLSACRVEKEHFRDYIVLGDDIVIGDEEVAQSYVQVCEDYGITIGFAKSFTSNIGFFQFASQDILGNTNISPISLKEVLSISLRDRLNTYSSGITSLGNKCEFVSRLIGKGFVDPSNPLSLVRAIVPFATWKVLAKDLSKGILPARIQDFLLSMLSSTRWVENNTFSVSQIMAILYGDIFALTKAKSYSPLMQSEFISELWSLSNEIVTDKLNRAMVSVSKGSVTNLTGWCIDNHFYSTIVNFERAKFMTSIMKLRKAYSVINKQVQADITHNRIVTLIEMDAYLNIEYFHITEINRILAEIEALRIEIDVFNDTINSLSSTSQKVPPRVSAFLSLRSYLEKTENPMSLVVRT